MYKITDTVTLLSGTEMPRFGFGTYKVPDGQDTYRSVISALENGYRLIDTAAIYGNEQSVGQALKDSGIPRDDVFITTKLWNAEHGYNSALRACETSLQTLGLDVIDLYLMHWPGQDSDARLRSWDALQELMRRQLIRAAGVSNFLPHHIDGLIAHSGITPCVNQIELHPFLQQAEMRRYAKQHNMAITAWGPLLHGHLAEMPLAAEIGERHGKTAAQVVLRWHLQHGICIIPKSVKPHRIRENADIFDFALSDDDMAAIDAVDNGTRFGPHPDTLTMGFRT